MGWQLPGRSLYIKVNFRHQFGPNTKTMRKRLPAWHSLHRREERVEVIKMAPINPVFLPVLSSYDVGILVNYNNQICNLCKQWVIRCNNLH